MSAPKLPKGLPPLPPVPAGYCRWKYMGMGWDSCGPVQHPWAGTYDSGEHWQVWSGERGTASNFQTHYIVAVRDPKPAPKKPKCKCSLRLRAVGDGCAVCNPELAAEIAAENATFTEATKSAIGKITAPKKRRAKARGRVMYQYPPRGECYNSPTITQRLAGEKLHTPLKGHRVLVIPFDPASREALVDQMAEAILRGNDPRSSARCALATLHPDFNKEEARHD